MLVARADKNHYEGQGELSFDRLNHDREQKAIAREKDLTAGPRHPADLATFALQQ